MDDHFELWAPPANLIDKNRLPGIPRHGIGRALKVSKEQIAALLTALQLFTSGAYDRELADMERWLERIAEALTSTSVKCIILPSDGQSYPLLEITVSTKQSAFAVCRALRAGKPSVQVSHGQLAAGKLVIHPLHLLNEERTNMLMRRLMEELQ